MDYQTDISPITKIKKIVYSKYKIVIEKIYFGENKADVYVILVDETEENMKEFYYTLTNVEYLNWSTDSSLREIIKQKIRNEVF